MVRIRRRASGFSTCTARSRASLTASGSCGLHRNAWRSSVAAPANSLSTSAPPWSARDATYSLATRFIPSRSGVTIITSAATYIAASSERLYD